MTTVQTRAALQAENRRLRAQLEALRKERAPIQIDPAEGLITIDGYQTEQFTIEHLSAHSHGLKDAAVGLAQVEQWIAPPGHRRRTPDLNGTLAGKIQVDELRMTVPFSAVNEMIPKLAGREMKKAGVVSLQVGKGRTANELSIKGRAEKLFLDVDFHATGRLTADHQGKPTFRLEQTRVAGLAVPNFLASFAAAVLSGESMKDLGIKQRGSEFTIDPNKMLPPNIDSPVTTIGIADEGFLIEGGSRSGRAAWAK